MTDDLCVDDGGAAPELGGVFMKQLAIGVVVGLGDVLGEPAVHQSISPAPKLLTPCPVLSL